MKNSVKNIAFGVAMTAGILATMDAAMAANLGGTTETIHAPVISVQENYSTQRVSNPQRVCETVEVPVYGYVGGGSGATGGDILTGAIIGGIIGNNIKGEKNGGAAGAIIGGMLGNAHGNNRSKGQQVVTGYRTEQRCSMQRNYSEQVVVTGYNVTCELEGRNHTVVMNSQPGDYIVIRKRVTYQVGN